MAIVGDGDRTATDGGAGYTMLPNWIIDRMAYLSPLEIKVILLVARKTIGWHKEQDQISLSQFANGTGLSLHSVIKALRRLTTLGLLESGESGKRGVHGYRIVAQAPSSLADDLPVEMTTARRAVVQPAERTTANGLLHQTTESRAVVGSTTAPGAVELLHGVQTQKKLKEKDPGGPDAHASEAKASEKDRSRSAEKSKATIPKEPLSREDHQFWAVLCREFNIPAGARFTAPARDKFNAAIKAFREIGVVPDQVPDIKRNYRLRFGRDAPTPWALVGQLPLCLAPPGPDEMVNPARSNGRMTMVGRRDDGRDDGPARLVQGHGKYDKITARAPETGVGIARAGPDA